MPEHDRPAEDAHTDYGAKEHRRRMEEGDEEPGGNALNEDAAQAPLMPGRESDEGSSHGGV